MIFTLTDIEFERIVGDVERGGRTKGILYPAIVSNVEFGVEMIFHADTKDVGRPPTE